MFRNSAEPRALRTRFPDRQKTSVETTAAAVTFQWCMWGKEENGRQFPQPFWKTPFDPLKYEVAGPTPFLLPHGVCSSFFISIAQYPGSPKPLSGARQSKNPPNFAVLGERQIQHIPCGLSQPHSTSRSHLTCRRCQGEENNSEDLFEIKHSGLKDYQTTASTGITV